MERLRVTKRMLIRGGRVIDPAGDLAEALPVWALLQADPRPSGSRGLLPRQAQPASLAVSILNGLPHSGRRPTGDEQLWYYRELVGAFRRPDATAIVGELDRVVSELEALVNG